MFSLFIAFCGGFGLFYLLCFVLDAFTRFGLALFGLIVLACLFY